MDAVEQTRPSAERPKANTRQMVPSPSPTQDTQQAPSLRPELSPPGQPETPENMQNRPASKRIIGIYSGSSSGEHGRRGSKPRPQLVRADELGLWIRSQKSLVNRLDAAGEAASEPETCRVKRKSAKRTKPLLRPKPTTTAGLPRKADSSPPIFRKDKGGMPSKAKQTKKPSSEVLPRAPSNTGNSAPERRSRSVERSRESQPRKQRGSPGRHEWLYRKGSAMLLQRQAEDDAWARRKEEEELAECTFKPKINKASKDLVSLKYSQDGSFYDRQVAWAAKREAKLAEERALKPPPPEEDMSECTFSPRINPIPRYLASEMGPSEPQTAVKGAGHGYRKSRESWSPARLDVGHRQPEARTSIQEGPGEARGGTRVRPLRAPTPHKTDAAGFAAADNEVQQEDSLLAGLQLIKRWEDSEQHSAHQGTGSQEPWSGWLAKQAISNLQWSIDNESEGDGEGDEVQDGMDSAPRANTTGRPADTSMSDTLDVSLDQFINRFEGLGLGSDEDTMDYLGQSYEADQREGEDGAEAEQQTNEAEEEEEGHRGISSESRQFRRVTREHLPAEKIHTKWNETTQAEATRISDALAVYGSVRRSGDGARLAGTPGDGDEQAAPGVEQKAKNRKPSSVPPCPTAKHGQAKKRAVLKSWQK